MNVETVTAETFESLWEKAREAGEQELPDQAADLYLQAAELKADDIDALLIIGEALEAIRRFGKAIDVYQMVLEIEKDNVIAYAAIGEIFIKIEKYPMAIHFLEKTNKLKPGNTHIVSQLAIAYRVGGESEKSEQAYREAEKLDAEPAFVFTHLAMLFEQSNQMEKLKDALREGLNKVPGNQYLRMLSAKFERREGKLEDALGHLLALEVETEDLDLKTRITFELGVVNNLLGNYDEAYRYYKKGNEMAEQLPLNRNVSKDKGLDLIKRLQTQDWSNWAKPVAKTLKKPEKNPIFLVGFPRSGTTLLNQILDSHSQLVGLEERPMISLVRRDIKKQFNSYPEGLTGLGTKEFNELRTNYLEYADHYSAAAKGVFLVDKNPMNILDIPLIIKIFPKSKILLALRHPCDCTLSCFMQHFGANDGMLNFRNLDDATYYYQQVFTLWLDYIKTLEFEYYTIVYENLVEDFEGEARKLISYLDLEWDPNVLNYAKVAKEKGRINTPSYHQVIKPIYKDAKDRWRHYQKYLEPYKARLAPFCEEFGYSL